MSEHIADSVLYSDAFHKLLGEDVLQVLKCGICLEFYENPVVLPCGHTFCYNCLLQMGKHANRNKNFVSVHDLTIGCPNCRCPIFVIALLKRDVTLNYPIQSLIDGLKVRQDIEPKKIEASTNTIPESEPEKEKEQSSFIATIPTQEFENITQEIDRFTIALQGGSIINDAFINIEKIRNDHLKSKTNAEKCTEFLSFKKDKPTTSSAFLEKCDKENIFNVSKSSQAEVGLDPAIVSYSMGSSGFNGAQQQNLSIY